MRTEPLSGPPPTYARTTTGGLGTRTTEWEYEERINKDARLRELSGGEIASNFEVIENYELILEEEIFQNHAKSQQFTIRGTQNPECVGRANAYFSARAGVAAMAGIDSELVGRQMTGGRREGGTRRAGNARTHLLRPLRR